VYTTLKTPIQAGQTVIEVADQSLFAIGDVIAIGSETNIVKGFSSLILDHPLLHAHGLGEYIKIMRHANEGAFPGLPSVPGVITTSRHPMGHTTSANHKLRNIGIAAGVAGGAAALAGIGVAIAQAHNKNQALEANLGVSTTIIFAGGTTSLERIIRAREGTAAAGELDSSGSSGEDSIGSGSNNSVTIFLVIPLLCGICGLCIGAMIFLQRKRSRGWRHGGFDVDDEYAEEQMRMMPRGAPYMDTMGGGGGFVNGFPMPPVNFNRQMPGTMPAMGMGMGPMVSPRGSFSGGPQLSPLPSGRVQY
jgi:hypothetical protein